MKLKIQIIEDDPITGQDLKEILSLNNYEVTGVSKSYSDAINLFKKNKPDILLVDVGLKGKLDGINLIDKLLISGNTCPVVYLTGNSDSETKSRAFRTNPAAFLIKPFNVNTVIATLELAINKYNKQQASTPLKDGTELFMKRGDTFYRFNTRDIFYLEAEGSYCKIFTSEGEFLISGNLKTFENRLPNIFIRAHRSFLINKEKVTAINAQKVYLGKFSVTLGRQYKTQIKRHLGISG